MKIEKTFEVDAPQQAVWDFITSPEQVAPCIPGCTGAEEMEPGKYKAVVKTKVGPIKTTFKVKIETREVRQPEFAAYATSGEEGSRTSIIQAMSTLSLRQLDGNKTEVTYQSEINMLGRLGKFGSGLMQKVADSIGKEFIATMQDSIKSREQK